MEPRTLVPIPTLPPLDFAVSEEDQTSFRLDWTPQVSNDCLFRNWTIEVQLDTHCISGSGYTTCTPVLNQNWTIVPSCTLTTRTEVNCKAYNLQSYSFYAVRIKEGCSDATAESAYLRWFKLRAPTPPLGRRFGLHTRDSARELDLAWPKNASLHTGTSELGWYGPVLAENDTNVTFGETEQCIDVRAQSAWTVQELVATIPARAFDPTNVPIPVPECSLPERNATDCQIVGLHSFTLYDIRIREQCVHDTADSPYALTDALQTSLGTVVYIGTSPVINSKTYDFGATVLNSCQYKTKCCADEFAACYHGSKMDLLRTDMVNAGWGQDLYLSCVAETVPEEQKKRLTARPPSTFRAAVRLATSLTMEWLPYGSGGYLSDCYCSVWDIYLRRRGTEEWLLSPDCNTMPFERSTCTLNYLEENWLVPNTWYEIRLRQSCTSERLNSPWKTIEATTLPGCDFQQHSGKDDFFLCKDGFLANMFVGDTFGADGTGCWQHGGRAQCPKKRPWMCESTGSCARIKNPTAQEIKKYVITDHCCNPESCDIVPFGGGDRKCIVRPNAPVNLIITSPSTDSLFVDWD
ncbi:unnamed protein product, partial [Polarella glacialis]